MKIIKQKQAKTRSDLVKIVKIFILHGWSYSLHKWGPLVSILKNKNLDPILLKIPGLTEKIDRPWNMSDYVSWLLERIGNENEKVILLGHSNGGRIGMAFSIKYPDKVSKLILIDSAGIYHDELYIKLKRKVFGAIAKTGNKILRARIAKDLLYFLVGEKDYIESSENMKKTMVNLLDFDKNLKPEKIFVPTIIVWGENDGITPVSDAKALNEKIENSKLFIIEGARHSPQFTHAEKVLDIIKTEL